MARKVLWGSIVMAVTAQLLCTVVWASDAVSPTATAREGLPSSFVAACLVFLIPAGLTMLAVGASQETEATTVAVTGLIAIALGVVVYALVGFGFQFGGLGLISDLDGVQHLTAEWSPLDRVWGPGWGVIGLDGFMLLKDSSEGELLAVYLYYAALAATGLSIPLLAMARRLTFPPLLGLGLFFGAIVYPIFGNWVWGGGWLSQVGAKLGLGHSLVDFAGAGTVHALGGLVSLAGILVFGHRLERREQAAKPPPVHFPLMASLGTLLLLLGWLGLVVGDPLLSGSVSYAQILVNVLLAACAGILVASVYMWFATGGADALMVMRGAVSGLVAASASCAFVPPWAALLIGGIAGLLLPLSIYLLERRLRLDDPTAAVAMHGISGLWGLLAVGIFADGASGRGWNGVGPNQHLDVAGQGVSGLLVQPGFQPDWPQQMYAQILGVLALLVLALGFSWLVFGGLDSLASRAAGARSGVSSEAGRAPAED